MICFWLCFFALEEENSKFTTIVGRRYHAVVSFMGFFCMPFFVILSVARETFRADVPYLYVSYSKLVGFPFGQKVLDFTY